MKAVLFDLDGTLLPMDQDEFIGAYFTELAKVVCGENLAPETLKEMIWASTKAMIKNDGSRTNKEAFWDSFRQIVGDECERIKPLCDGFYSTDFHNVKAVTKENPLAKKAVQLAGEKGRKVVLSTNPLFPMDGQKTRISWIGLTEDDFEFITSYETDSFCKPNPQYFVSICERLGVKPEECLMVGNDEREDMYAASSIGMNCFLVTDCMIACEEHPWNGERGNFEDLIKKLENLE